MADQKLTLAIETKADTAGVTTAVTAVQSMDAAMQKLEQDAPEVAEALKKVQAATEQLGDKAAAGGKKVDELSDTQTKGAAGHRDSGRAVLEASRALEDLQYGIGGVLNNLPNLVQMLGMGAGLAGVISIVAVGLTQLAKHLDLTGPNLEAVATASAEAAISAGEHAREAGKQAVAMEKAETSAQELKDALDVQEGALQRQITALHDAATAAQQLETRQKALLQANQNLALAEVAADPGLSDVERIKRTNEIKLDYSKQAQEQELASLAASRAKAAEEQKAQEDLFRLLKAKAVEAKAADEALKENSRAQVEGAARAGQGKNELGGMLFKIDGIAESGNGRFPEKMLTGVGEKDDKLTQAKQMLANLVKFQEELSKPRPWTPGNTYIPNENDLAEASGAGFEQNKAQLERIIAEIEQGTVQSKLAKEEAPQVKATAEAYGDPKAVEQAAAAAARKAQEAQVRQRELEASEINRRQVFAANNKASVLTAGAEESRAMEDERRKKEMEEESQKRKQDRETASESKNVDSAMTKARALARNLQPGSAGAKALNNAASREDVDALIEIVNTLFEAQSTTKEELQKGVRKEIENLRNQVRNMRRNDKS